MRRKNENLITAPVSLATSVNFEAIWLGHIAMCAAQLVFTGTPAGNFKLQGSCDLGQPNVAGDAGGANVTNWSDIPNTAVTVSAAGNVLINVTDCGYDWVRVVYTATGAGTSPLLTSARIVVKGM